MSNISNYMSPEEINAYQVRRQAVNTAFGRGRANLDYQRGVAAQDYGLGKPRMTRSWDQAFRQLPSSFARRGILRSGVYNQGFSDYGTARENAFNDYDLQNARRNAGFQNQQDDFEAARTMQMGQIDSEMLARQAGLSAEIQRRM